MDGYKLVTNKSGENREGSLTITTEVFQEGFPKVEAEEDCSIQLYIISETQ